MKFNMIAFISILSLGLPNQGANLLQRPLVEQGRPDELNGVMKVFVDTTMEKQHQADIVKEIQKKLPTLEIVLKPDDADIQLKFSLQSKTQFDERLPHQRRPVRGVGKVVKVLSAERVRLLLEYEGKRTSADEFAKEFVKAYLGANGK